MQIGFFLVCEVVNSQFDQNSFNWLFIKTFRHIELDLLSDCDMKNFNYQMTPMLNCT
jgi:hypothetical protein